MGTFRGLICNNDADYNGKNTALHNRLKKLSDYNSQAYSRKNGKANIYTTDGKPILVEPKRQHWIDECNKLPLNFQDLDTSIIKQNEI